MEIAPYKKPRTQNAPGNLYVDESCIDCKHWMQQYVLCVLLLICELTKRIIKGILCIVWKYIHAKFPPVFSQAMFVVGCVPQCMAERESRRPSSHSQSQRWRSCKPMPVGNSRSMGYSCTYAWIHTYITCSRVFKMSNEIVHVMQ